MAFGGLPYPGSSNGILPNGWDMGLWMFGQTVFYCVIITVTLELMLEHKYVKGGEDARR